MDSDEVNSIYDTVEALQVATIVVETFEAEFGNVEIPAFDRILKLESVSDLNRPNYLRYGGDVSAIKWLRYRDARNHGRYVNVHYLEPTSFFDRLTQSTGRGRYDMKVTDPSGVSYFITTNSAPHFYTSVDNNYLIFDGYDSKEEDTLEERNSFCIGSTSVSDGLLEDDFVFPIPGNYFPLLLAEAKATCFLTIKQMPSPKSEQIARRQRSRVQNNMYKSVKANYPYARSKFDFSRKR
jgi:hypothetical protein